MKTDHGDRDPARGGGRGGGGAGPGAPEVDAAEARTAEARTAKTKLAEVVVVCARCAKRQGLRPRAVRDLLKRAAKQAAKEAAREMRGRGLRVERRRLCVVESGCLGPCPKRALAVATGASLAAGRVVLLDPAARPRDALAAVLGGAVPGGAGRSAPDPDFGPNADLAAGRPRESPDAASRPPVPPPAA